MKMPNPDVGVRELSGLAADPTGGLLLVGEDASGALLRSLRPGFEAVVATTVMNPLHGATSLHGNPSRTAALRRRAASRHSGARLIESVEQLRPDVVMLVKGRGITAATVEQVRSLGTTVACYYPDNSLWRGGDPGARERLAACDIAILWSARQAALLRQVTTRVEVVPFGYDPNWFPISDAGGERHGVAFLGTWSPRRERFIAALSELPVTVAGYGWAENSTIGGTPIVEGDAGAVLRNAAIGINLLHPQCAEAHNMRTREISSSGALQITEPGIDGTPLRDGESCLWFSTPQELRSRVEAALNDPIMAEETALKAQDLIKRDTYHARGRELAALVGLG